MIRKENFTIQNLKYLFWVWLLALMKNVNVLRTTVNNKQQDPQLMSENQRGLKRKKKQVKVLQKPYASGGNV